MAFNLEAFLMPYVKQVAEAGAAALNANSAKLLAEAKELNVKGVDLVASAAETAIAKSGTEGALIAPFVAEGVKAIEPTLVSAAGSEESLILSGAEAKIAQFISLL